MYKIPEQTLQAIVNYLVKKPYGEVANLVVAISKLKQEPEVPEVKKEIKKK